MAVFVHISTELKWLQIQRQFFVCLYIYVSVIHIETDSGQYGHILWFLLAPISHGAIGIMDAAVSDWITLLMQCKI